MIDAYFLLSITWSYYLEENENIKKISYSQYSIFAQCKHRWKLQYVDKLKPPEASINLTFGTAIHLTLQEYLTLHYKNEKRAKVFDLDGCLKEHLLETFKQDTIINEDESKTFPCDKATLLEFYHQGCAILSHVRKQTKTLFPTKNHILIGCEIPLEIMLTDNVQFIGYIDLIVQDTKSKEIHIFDFKTSGRGWFKEKTDPLKLHQVQLYKKYFAEQSEIDEDLVFVSFLILKRHVQEDSEWANARNRVNKFVPSQGKISTRKAAKALQDFHSTVYDAAGLIPTVNLPPEPSAKTCKYCPFKNQKNLCPVGIN